MLETPPLAESDAPTEGGAPSAEPFHDPVLEELDSLLETPLARAWLTDEFAAIVPLAEAEDDDTGVVAPLPRRQSIGGAAAEEASLPRAKEEGFSAPAVLTALRLPLWLWAFARNALGAMLDSLLRQDTLERRVVRFRETIESLGPTFVKIGQQLSVRADILPYPYCAELWKILDDAEPFDVKHAIATIERATGEPIKDTAAVFDPEPVASTSLACVYQAVLKSGDKVAIKVRRPGFSQKLAADVRALGWILSTAEILSLVRSGWATSLVRGLVEMFTEELDFGREARYSSIFRNRAAEHPRSWFDAPKVYRDLSSSDVLVTHYVSGVFLSEILTALDTNDQDSLDQLRASGIDPKTIARRLAELFHWELMESLLFHADPHPENIVCRPGNRIVLLDFGSCGRFSNKTRRLWDQLHHYMAGEDVQGMVECSIAMIEPLPPIDVTRYTREVETLYWESLYGSRDHGSAWWERARGVLWLRFAAIGRNYGVPINIDTLRLFRATFLYDAVILGLDPDIKIDEEYLRYYRKAARSAKKRVKRKLRKRLEKGPTDRDYLAFEELGRQANQLIARTRRNLDNPQHAFRRMVGKAAYGAAVVLRLLMALVSLHLIAVVVAFIYRSAEDPGGMQEIGAWDALLWIMQSPGYQFVLIVVGLVIIRKALMRVEDVDV